MYGSLLLLATMLYTLLGPSPGFTLDVRGAVTTTAKGPAQAGTVGTPNEAFYSIALGGPESDAAVVFTRAGSDAPRPGDYRVGDGELSRGGFSGLVITGMPAHPTGVFWVESGTLTITASSANRLEGRFALSAAGFLVESPENEGRKVSAEGAFAARAGDRDSNLALIPGAGQ
jgi:hypothetical protein